MTYRQLLERLKQLDDSQLDSESTIVIVSNIFGHKETFGCNVSEMTEVSEIIPKFPELIDKFHLEQVILIGY